MDDSMTQQSTKTTQLRSDRGGSKKLNLRVSQNDNFKSDIIAVIAV
jgi:hypothetical protein